jgi:hypothetical protein
MAAFFWLRKDRVRRVLRAGDRTVRKLAAIAILAMLAAPAMADSDKHRRYDPRYTYGSIVSHCQQRANDIRLRGSDRRDFVDWCTARGSRFVARDWDRRDWDRMSYLRDRYRDRYLSDRRFYRDDWDDDFEERYLWRILTSDPYFRYRDGSDYWRYGRDDWRYAALQDFLVWSLRN